MKANDAYVSTSRERREEFSYTAYEGSLVSWERYGKKRDLTLRQGVLYCF